jgi:hypothetical protein
MMGWVQRQCRRCCGSKSIGGQIRGLAAKFSRLLELRAQDAGPFNYPIAVFSEWRGKAFYLNALETAGPKMISSSGTRG